jgi:hypothetical protein
MKLSKAQNVIIRDLFRAGGKLDCYTFYRRYHYSPSELIGVINKLIKEELVSTDNTQILLAPKGKTLIVENGLYIDKRFASWKSVPEEFSQEKIPPWEPYIPVAKLLDKSIFPKSSSLKNSGGEQ